VQHAAPPSGKGRTSRPEINERGNFAVANNSSNSSGLTSMGSAIEGIAAH
jgi:hypothetical protein